VLVSVRRVVDFAKSREVSGSSWYACESFVRMTQVVRLSRRRSNSVDTGVGA